MNIPNRQQTVTPSRNPLKLDYQQWVAKAMMILHSKETRDAVLTMLKAKDPVQSVADATVLVVQRLDAAMRQKGTEVDDTVKLIGAHQVVSELSSIAKAGGLFDLGEREQELALSVAVQDYVKGEIAAGRIDGAKLQAQMARAVRQMPRKERAEMDASVARIAQTAQKYAGGR